MTLQMHCRRRGRSRGRAVFAIIVTAGFLSLAAGAARATTYAVDPGGSDGGAGSAASPWKTLQHAADTVRAGDTVIVHAGHYAGFDLTTSGTQSAPITFSGQTGALIDQDNPRTPDGINVEGVSYVVIEGFEVDGAGRAGIRAATCDHVTIRHNHADQNTEWGIFTAFCNDLVIENNETSRSLQQHGIYTSNSGDRPIIRGNLVWGNNDNGIHMNGDVSQGGDGIISGALVADNILYDNGAAGGSAINCDGVQDSTFENNLIYANHAAGISLYDIDGAAGSKRNLVINNTIVMPSGSRWAVQIFNGSTANTVENNLLLHADTSKGAIAVDSASLAGLVADYNAGAARFSVDGANTTISLAAWQARGFGAHSFVASASALFVDAAGDDFHLASASPAVGAGTAQGAPATDLDGNARPSGAAVDLGAYAFCGGAGCSAGPAPDGGASGSGGSGGGTGGGGSGGGTGGGGATPDAGAVSGGGGGAGGGATPDAGSGAADNPGGGTGSKTGHVTGGCAIDPGAGHGARAGLAGAAALLFLAVALSRLLLVDRRRRSPAPQRPLFGRRGRGRR